MRRVAANFCKTLRGRGHCGAHFCLYTRTRMCPSMVSLIIYCSIDSEIIKSPAHRLKTTKTAPTAVRISRSLYCSIVLYSSRCLVGIARIEGGKSHKATCYDSSQVGKCPAERNKHPCYVASGNNAKAKTTPDGEALPAVDAMLDVFPWPQACCYCLLNSRLDLSLSLFTVGTFWGKR